MNHIKLLLTDLSTHQITLSIKQKLFFAILANDGLTTEGIFRRSGNARSLKTLQALLERLHANVHLQLNSDYINGTPPPETNTTTTAVAHSGDEGDCGETVDVGTVIHSPSAVVVDHRKIVAQKEEETEEEVHCLQSDLQKLAQDYTVYDLAVILKVHQILTLNPLILINPFYLL